VGEASPSLAFDRVAHEYDRTRGGPERGAEVAAAIAPLLPRDGTVLEVGVGTGLVGVALAGMGRAVAGVDLSLPMLRRAVERLPGRVVAGDALRLPVRSGSVAAVVMIHVVHVVGDMVTTFAEAGRVVRRGGRIVVSARPDEQPADSDLSGILTDLQRQVGLDERSLDRESPVTATARRAGLEVVGRSTYRPRYSAISPADAAWSIEARTWSWTWQVEDRLWAPMAARAVEALRRLPDPERPRTHEIDVPLLAFAHAGHPAATTA
jgi:SAM-dependent methyltransferase